MRSVLCRSSHDAPAPTLMVWLPGAYQAPEDFLVAGFDSVVRQRALPIDLMFVDLELKFLGDREGGERLRSGIIDPARAVGHRHIWLAGISLGGFAVLDVAATNPDVWDGLCVFAPYLGSRMVLKEISRAGGLANWQSPELDEERRLWAYLRDRHPERRPLYLGYGRQDRFSQAHELLAAALSPDMVDVVSGGHDWPTWTTLWENFLDSTFS